ncbi:MAG: response regulator transcription factor [Gammaproteobacteria bacterium]|nr:response regulator transcription factor [Gammaproteobacteria bacterium]
MIHFAVIDDHPMNYAAMEYMQCEFDNLKYVGGFSNHKLFLTYVKDMSVTSVDAIILDWAMPIGGRLEAIDAIGKIIPEIKYIVYTQFFTHHVIETCRSHNDIRAVVSKSCRPETILATLQEVCTVDYQGSFLVRGDEMSTNLSKLKPKQLAIFKDLVNSLSPNEISEKRQLSISTVRYHIANLYEILGAENIADLTKIAYNAGILDHTSI